MALQIWECQPGAFCRHTDEPLQEGYRFTGRRNGLYEFATREGKRELFARRKAFAGWHLKRGAFVYEFCSSVQS